MNVTEQKFARLVKQHKQSIYTVCLMFAEDQDDANDLMQEALISIWKGLASLREDSNLKSWIWRVTMNTCITLDGQRRKHREIEASVADLLSPTTEDNKQIRMLHDRIHRLQPFDRAIVMLWLEDMSYDEIGQIVGISAKNVSVRLVRIREELKKMNEASL